MVFNRRLAIPAAPQSLQLVRPCVFRRRPLGFLDEPQVSAEACNKGN